MLVRHAIGMPRDCALRLCRLPAHCPLPTADCRLQVSLVEGLRQQIPQLMSSRFAAEVGEDDLDVAAELPEDLAARAAGRCRLVRLADDGDAAEFAVAIGDRLEHGDALRAD